MQTPSVSYRPDEVTTAFIDAAIGIDAWQHLMVGAEVLILAGLASRDLRMEGLNVAVAVKATSDLAHLLETMRSKLHAPD